MSSAAYKREYRAKNRERLNANKRRWYRENADQLRELARERTKGHRQALRAQAIEAYGGKCACCGEPDPAFLTFDHVNNDGAEHRRELFGSAETAGRARPQTSSKRFLYWLRDNDYPDSIQLHCANCQLGKVRGKGVCPHQKEVMA